MTGAKRDEKGNWIPSDNDPMSSHAATMLSLAETGQLTRTPYKFDGSPWHDFPTYGEMVTPEEANRRRLLADPRWREIEGSSYTRPSPHP